MIDGVGNFLVRMGIWIWVGKLVGGRHSEGDLCGCTNEIKAGAGGALFTCYIYNLGTEICRATVKIQTRNF